MKNTFQSLRRAAFLTAMGLALAPASWAQGAANYPAPGSTIKIVVGYAPGGPTDLAARLIAGKLQTAFGVNVVVENKPGAGSNTASELVAAAEPNGYTLLVAAAPLASNPHFFKKIRFDPSRASSRSRKSCRRPASCRSPRPASRTWPSWWMPRARTLAS